MEYVVIYLDDNQKCVGFAIADDKKKDKLVGHINTHTWTVRLDDFENWQANVDIRGTNKEFSAFKAKNNKIYFKNREGWERFIDMVNIPSVSENIIIEINNQNSQLQPNWSDNFQLPEGYAY